MQLLKLSNGLKAAYKKGGSVAQRVKQFDGWTDRATSEDADGSGYDHTETVKEYYNLCNEIMVFGWSESLHFAPLTSQETLEESILRHQRSMISKLELQQGMKVVDVGCGIGGPMRRVVREAGVRVVGINNSEVQLAKAKTLNASAGVDSMTEFIACSFMDMNTIEDKAFDRAYAIESTCHAPDKERAFAEIFRVLKPGALFWGQEMCLTNEFDRNNRNHQAIEQELKHGIAIKEIATFDEVNQALETAGFQIVEAMDRNVTEGQSIPWYSPMEAQREMQLRSLIRGSSLSRRVAIAATKVAVLLKLFPHGSADVISLMARTADAYLAGGREGIFTPLYCFLARKPE